MRRNPLTTALCDALWPWTAGKFSPWWLGSTVMAGHDEFLWSWNYERFEAVGLTA